jgi:hypothetical protein
VTVVPQKLFEAIAQPEECQRFKSLAPNGCGKSEGVFPVCQALSGGVVPPERLGGRDLPGRHSHDRPQRRSEFQSGEHLAAPRPECGSSGETEWNVRTEL